MRFLTVDDLNLFVTIDDAKAQEMIDDATALATLAAPCLDTEPTTLTTGQIAAVKAILRGAIIRWHEAGSGALQSQTVGPFSQAFDTRQQRRGMFWPSEIVELQNICGGGRGGGAYMVDTTPAGDTVTHLDTCSLNFGANYCSCGAILAGFPIYEGA